MIIRQFNKAYIIYNYSREFVAVSQTDTLRVDSSEPTFNKVTSHWLNKHINNHRNVCTIFQNILGNKPIWLVSALEK